MIYDDIWWYNYVNTGLYRRVQMLVIFHSHILSNACFILQDWSVIRQCRLGGDRNWNRSALIVAAIWWCHLGRCWICCIFCDIANKLDWIVDDVMLFIFYHFLSFPLISHFCYRSPFESVMHQPAIPVSCSHLPAYNLFLWFVLAASIARASENCRRLQLRRQNLCCSLPCEEIHMVLMGPLRLSHHLWLICESSSKISDISFIYV